ncbi:hypothetical protein [Streptomyces sp. NPDC014793]|uniref:hypothetical protein n=1 Tax=Streptomyces sp. NPDC014793 TaxID=3364914 RepID=UPI0037000634
MQSEIVVTLISTLGTVWVAFLTVRGSARRDHRPYIGPLMGLSDFCGYATGVARAAMAECETAFQELAEGVHRAPVPAGDRVSAYRAEAGLDDPAPVGAEAHDLVRSELDTYTKATRAFQRRLSATGRTIDDVAGAGTLAPPQVERELLRHLPALRESLQALDAAFESGVDGYFQRYDSFMSVRARRSLRKKAENRYARSVTAGRNAVLEEAQRSADGSGGARTDPTGVDGDQPVCGHCIWRCPHAPDLSFVPASAGAAGEPDSSARSSASSGPHAVGRGGRGVAPVALPAARGAAR